MARKGERIGPKASDDAGWSERVGRPTPARRRADGAKRVPYIAQMVAAVRGISSRALPDRHRVLLFALASFCNPDGTECFPATETLAEIVGVTRSLLCRVLRELETAQWIARVPRSRPGRGGQTSTLYKVRLGGGPIVVLERKRSGRRALQNKPIVLPEGVADLAAKRIERARTANNATDK